MQKPGDVKQMSEDAITATYGVSENLPTKTNSFASLISTPGLLGKNGSGHSPQSLLRS